METTMHPVSVLPVMTQSVPAYWAPFKRLLIDRIGDAEGSDNINLK